MPRIKKEFYCSGGCQKYFDFKLNMSLDGNYRIHCPNCGHVHYRVVKCGVITDGRFPDNSGNILIEDIYPMKSSCRESQQEKREDSEISGDFLHQLWKEKFSCLT